MPPGLRGKERKRAYLRRRGWRRVVSGGAEIWRDEFGSVYTLDAAFARAQRRNERVSA